MEHAGSAAEPVFYLTQEFWVAMAFGVFVLLICRPVARFIVSALDARTKKIEGELSEARRLRAEAEATLAVYLKKQQESLEEAERILAHTRDDARRLAENAEIELKAALEKRSRLAVEKIAQAESKALQEVQTHLVDIAIAAARTLIQEHLSRGGNEELVKQAASELTRKLH